jgi:hypothetical protein
MWRLHTVSGPVSTLSQTRVRIGRVVSRSACPVVGTRKVWIACFIRRI